MKKLVYLIFLIPSFCFAQKLPDFGFDKIRLVEQDKIIQAELLPVSSDPDKKANHFYYWYGSNIIHTTQGSYSGKLLNGTYAEYYLDKSLKTQGQFKKGLKDGVWRSWNENGILTDLYSWDRGIKSGIFELFDDQGNVKQKGHYKDNVLVVENDSVSFWHKINIFKKKK